MKDRGVGGDMDIPKPQNPAPFPAMTRPAGRAF
jgi:hypothetical protein